MPAPVRTDVKFVTDPDGPAAVALIPKQELERLRFHHALSGNYAMVTAPGLPPDRAQRLRLQSATGDEAILRHADLLLMLGDGGGPTEDHLLVRALRLRERLGLVATWTTVLMVLAVAAGGFAIASLFSPVNEPADQAKTTSKRVVQIEPALSTLEQQPGNFMSLTRIATTVQLALSAPVTLAGSGAPRVLPRDQNLAETLEHAVGRSGTSPGEGQQAATDVESWVTSLQNDSRNSSPGWSSVFDTLSKLFAALAGILGAVIAFWRKPSP